MVTHFYDYPRYTLLFPIFILSLFKISYVPWIQSYDDPRYTLLLSICILSVFNIPYVPSIHIVMMTPDTHCYYPSLFYHYSLFCTVCALNTHCYHGSRYTLLLHILILSLFIISYVPWTNTLMDDPRYTLQLPIFILSLFSISYVPWIPTALMTPDTHCYYPSLNYHYLFYLTYPGYTLL